MSVTLSFALDALDLSQLHDELLRTSLVPEAVASSIEVTSTPAADPAHAPTETYQTFVHLTFADGIDEGDVEAVVDAHVPMTRFDPTDQLTEIAATRDAARRRGEFARLQTVFDNVADVSDVPFAGQQLIKLLRALYNDLGLRV